MSNIDKQACQVSRYDLVSGYMQKWPDGEFVYHSDYQELLDKLEAKEEQRANWYQMAEKLGADLDAAERRIAELESREVKLPERYDIEICPTPSPDGDWYSCDDVLAALKAAGIKFVAGTGNILKA
ncbi:TPA: hypothetical protein ACXIV6_000983 [Enterobacter roggenkampii]